MENQSNFLTTPLPVSGTLRRDVTVPFDQGAVTRSRRKRRVVEEAGALLSRTVTGPGTLEAPVELQIFVQAVKSAVPSTL